MSEYMPLDGQREAASYHAGEDWLLAGEMLLPSRHEGDSEVYTWEWSRDDTGDLVGSIDWSADDNNGVRIHGYAGDDGTGPWFAGEYWLVERYGPAWMLLPGQEEKWDLVDYDWAAE